MAVALPPINPLGLETANQGPGFQPDGIILRKKGLRPKPTPGPGVLLQRTTASLTENALFGIDRLHRRRRRASLRWRANMPGNPKECRQHALNCVQLAKAAQSQEARGRFAHLARTWIRLAEELERIQAVLAEGEDEQELEQTG